jgi:hypothetical protein
MPDDMRITGGQVITGRPRISQARGITSAMDIVTVCDTLVRSKNNNEQE